jgi:uncharacterized protein YbcV (DUF1398 family)
MNYIIVHRESNLITNVVSSSNTLASTKALKVIKAGELTLNHYYRLKAKADIAGVMVDAGDLAKHSPNFKELLQLK